MNEVKRYTKKPVTIEVVHLCEPNTPDDVASWCGGKVCGVGAVGEKMWIEISTLEGPMRADYGDYIIKGVNDEFYPCKPDVFEKIEKTYTLGMGGDELTTLRADLQRVTAERDALEVAINDLKYYASGFCTITSEFKTMTAPLFEKIISLASLAAVKPDVCECDQDSKGRSWRHDGEKVICTNCHKPIEQKEV